MLFTAYTSQSTSIVADVSNYPVLSPSMASAKRQIHAEKALPHMAHLEDELVQLAIRVENMERARPFEALKTAATRPMVPVQSDLHFLALKRVVEDHSETIQAMWKVIKLQQRAIEDLSFPDA